FPLRAPVCDGRTGFLLRLSPSHSRAPIGASVRPGRTPSAAEEIMLEFLKKLFRGRAIEPSTADKPLQAAVAGQHRAETGLRQSEEHFRLQVEGVRDYAIFLLDLQGHVVTWNTGAERLKGYTAEEMIGQHFSRFYLPEDVQSGKPGRELEI